MCRTMYAAAILLCAQAAYAEIHVLFFLDEAEFQAALEQAGKVVKDTEDFPWEAGPGDVIGSDDPLGEPDPPCRWDLTDDGSVGVPDLLILLAFWGPCSPVCLGDLDGDDNVGVNDLLILLANWGPCGALFFNNFDEFAAAIEALGKTLKGSEEYPWSAGPGSVIVVDDPLNGNTSVPGWIKPGIILDNITYQSNLDPFGANGPNPRGGNGLALFTTGFLGATHNGFVANHFVDSLDILSGVPGGDNHTAVGMQIAAFNNSPAGSSVTVSVYDKDDNLLGQSEDISAPANLGGAFLGIIANGGNTIGRVNIYDVNAGFDAEGLYGLTVYVSGGEPCPWDLDGNSDVGVGDLLILLGAWGPNPGHPADFDANDTVGVSDLLALLANWGPCP